MNIYIALSLFSLIILLYWVISEVFTILFRLAGLPEERARFQVTSLLTGCGFTTKESEILLSSRKRRLLARVTMLFGYVFNVTIVSAIINIFFSLNISQWGSSFLAVLIPLCTVALIIVIMRIPKMRAKETKIFQKLANRIADRSKTYNPVLLLDHIGEESIALVTLNNLPAELEGQTLAQSRLRSNTGILVMLVESPGEKPEAPGPETMLCKNDKITVFGDFHAICRTFGAKEQFDDED